VRQLEGILERKCVKSKRALEKSRVLGRGLTNVHPDDRGAIGLQPLRVECLDLTGSSVPVDVVGNQSPTFTCRAACAAARRATGMR
jgi:hypothetical protein